jgi:hypothetical protein
MKLRKLHADIIFFVKHARNNKLLFPQTSEFIIASETKDRQELPLTVIWRLKELKIGLNARA